MLFANAGGGSFAPLGAITEEPYAATFDTNVKGLVFAVQKALPLMPDGASIILNGSTTSAKGLPAFSVYSASKAAVRSFARSWTTDLKARKIRVNTISAGPVKTLSAMAVGGIDEMFEHTIKKAPLHRNIDGDEVGKTAVYLLSDLSSGVTGENIYVDSGFNIVGL